MIGTPRRGVTPGLPTNPGSFKADEKAESGIALAEVTDDDLDFARETLGPDATDEEVRDLAEQRAERDGAELAREHDDTFLSPIEPLTVDRLWPGASRIDSYNHAGPTETGDARARITAGAAVYADVAGHFTDDDLAPYAALRKAVTLLTERDGVVVIREGRLTDNGVHEGVSLIAKGKRAAGEWVDPAWVLDLQEGYGHGHGETLARTWQRRKAQFVPTLEPVTGFDDIEAITFDPRDMSQRVQAVYLLADSHYGPDLPAGSLFLVLDNGTEHSGRESLFGRVWVPGEDRYARPMNLEGEFLRGHSGRISDYRGDLTLGEALHDMPTSRVEAYRRVTGRTWTHE